MELDRYEDARRKLELEYDIKMAKIVTGTIIICVIGSVFLIGFFFGH